MQDCSLMCQNIDLISSKQINHSAAGCTPLICQKLVRSIFWHIMLHLFELLCSLMCEKILLMRFWQINGVQPAAE